MCCFRYAYCMVRGYFRHNIIISNRYKRIHLHTHYSLFFQCIHSQWSKQKVKCLRTGQFTSQWLLTKAIWYIESPSQQLNGIENIRFWTERKAFAEGHKSLLISDSQYGYSFAESLHLTNMKDKLLGLHSYQSFLILKYNLPTPVFPIHASEQIAISSQDSTTHGYPEYL